MTSEHSRRRFLASVGAAGSVAVAGCSYGGGDGRTIEPVETPYDLSVPHDIENWSKYDPEWSPPESSPADATLRTETIVENLEIPWDMSFADDGTLFFSERVGRISRYEAGEIERVTEPEDVIDHASATAPEFRGQDWWAGGSEGGLLGIALHPNYPDVPVLYAYYTYEEEPPSDDNEEGVYRNRLVLYDLGNDAEESVVVDDIPGHRIIHNGARLAFGPRNYLWVTTGDAGKKTVHPQDTGSLAGKILRLKPDGTPPEDNPGFDDPRIHTVGHRNPQSISWFPDGTAVAGEHGEQARDEVNVIEGGNNYGWPKARGGPDDDSYGSYTDFPEFTPPVVNTGTETWAPPGGVVYTGGDVPALAGRFVLGGLISQRLNVVSMYEGTAPDIGGTRFDADWMHPDYDAVAHTFLEDELGRIRHVEQGPNGELYAVTSNRDGRSSEPTEDAFPTESDDRLVRIVQE